ncbi:MAG: hypothetical protein RLZZ04_4912, partial [Cyanobacteriota bacterium]
VHSFYRTAAKEICEHSSVLTDSHPMGACNQGEKVLNFDCVSSGVDTPSKNLVTTKNYLRQDRQTYNKW